MSRATNRRSFLRNAATGAAVLGGASLPKIARAQLAPAFVSSDRPQLAQGIQIGDPLANSAVVWARSDRTARLLVEWSTSPSFKRSTRVHGPHATEATDFIARLDLQGLPDNQDIFVRVAFENAFGKGASGAPVLGRFRTAPHGRRNIRLVWTGDTAGQGWGSNPDIGGMKLYKTMQDQEPDVFLHSGDNIYADGPMQPTVKLADGTVWKNAFLDKVPQKLKVAETLDEFRGAYRYNLCDDNVRSFNANVAQIWQWDDHETLNNWSPSKDLSGDSRYTEKNIATLVSRSTRAFLDYAPMRWHGVDELERVYRHIPYGRELDIFVLDMRSYRAGNGPNRQTQPGPDTAYLGREQIEWLKEGLRRSRATWKIIAADMPLGLVVADGKDASGTDLFENSANGDGPVLGREFEIAEILRFVKRADVKNTVWLTADVHYCAAHHYDPSRAQFQDFDPFWEFVAGPANAGTFGPSPLDNTFGPRVVFQKAPPPGQSNLPPSAGYQFFGQIDIDPRARDLVVSLKDINGNTLFSQQLAAEPCAGFFD